MKIHRLGALSGVAALLAACASNVERVEPVETNVVSGTQVHDNTAQCSKNADCKGTKTICNAKTQQCVECLPTQDICAAGYFCDAEENKCVERPKRALIDVKPLAPGADCAAGGTTVRTGIDENRNGVLDAIEVQSSSVICNGAGGKDGVNSLVTTTDVAAGAICAAGGTRIDVGLDANKNNVLDASEIVSSKYVCNGVAGQNGVNGQDGKNGHDGKVKVTAEPAGANCVAGGQRIDTGTDLDDSGALDAGEITGTAFVCNGANGASSLIASSAEAAGSNCSAGGEKVDTGVDQNQNGKLDASEVLSTFYVCNGSAPSMAVTKFDDDVCDASIGPNVADGVFADAVNGNDLSGNGTPEAPVKSVGKAIALAGSFARHSIYLAEGTYGGFSLPSSNAVYIEGGWVRGTSWHRNCAANARDATVITGGVSINGGEGGIRTMTVQAPGTYPFIPLRAMSGKLALRDVAAAAPVGAHGTAGVNASPPANATGSTWSCSTGANGVDGANGAPSPGVTFDSSGTPSPKQGGGGVYGASGANGTQATQLSCAQGYCGTSYTWGLKSCAGANYTYPAATAQGSCGWGGQGGAAGSGGTDGRSSIALSVGTNAQVLLTKSTLSAGAGGNGAPGGLGTSGASGSSGQASSCTHFTGQCDANCSSIVETRTSSAGGQGGAGGRGGNGGHGAGGYSAAIMKVGGASVTVDAATSLTFGAAGTGGGGAPDGQAGAIVQK